MNLEHPKFKPFIQYYVHLPAQHVNEVSFKCKLRITMKAIAFRSHIFGRLSGGNDQMVR